MADSIGLNRREQSVISECGPTAKKEPIFQFEILRSCGGNISNRPCFQTFLDCGACDTKRRICRTDQIGSFVSLHFISIPKCFFCLKIWRVVTRENSHSTDFTMSREMCAEMIFIICFKFKLLLNHSNSS